MAEHDLLLWGKPTMAKPGPRVLKRSSIRAMTTPAGEAHDGDGFKRIFPKNSEFNSLRT
jgi:hypothetical protein